MCCLFLLAVPSYALEDCYVGKLKFAGTSYDFDEGGKERVRAYFKDGEVVLFKSSNCPGEHEIFGDNGSDIIEGCCDMSDYVFVCELEVDSSIDFYIVTTGRVKENKAGIVRFSRAYAVGESDDNVLVGGRLKSVRFEPAECP